MPSQGRIVLVLLMNRAHRQEGSRPGPAAAGWLPKPATDPIQREVRSKIIDRFAARGDARPPSRVLFLSSRLLCFLFVSSESLW
jgi:hypothetical protein